MPELTQGISQLDVRLADLDRQLRAIQADLVPGREPAPPLAEPAEGFEPEPEIEPEPEAEGESPPEPPEPGPVAHRGRSGPLASLLARSRRPHAPPRADPEPAPAPAVPRSAAPPDLQTLSQMHEQLLATLRELVDLYGLTVRRALGSPQASELTVSAGPFASTAAVDRFIVEIEGLASVGEVSLRGYEGEDRALLEVQLSGAS